jgi:hypothetical protein
MGNDIISVLYDLELSWGLSIVIKFSRAAVGIALLQRNMLLNEFIFSKISFSRMY